MSEPAPQATLEGEVRGQGWEAFAEAWGQRRDMGQCYGAAFEVWEQYLRRAVAAAEKSERERVAQAIEADMEARRQRHRVTPNYQNGMRKAAAIARGEA